MAANNLNFQNKSSSVDLLAGDKTPNKIINQQKSDGKPAGGIGIVKSNKLDPISHEKVHVDKSPNMIQKHPSLAGGTNSKTNSKNPPQQAQTIQHVNNPKVADLNSKSFNSNTKDHANGPNG